MTPLDYGRIEIMIRPSKTGKIYLAYKCYDGMNRVICRLDDCRFRHRNVNNLYYWNELVQGGKFMHFKEANMWLFKYCKHFGLNPDEYHLVKSFSTQLTKQGQGG